MTPPWLARPVLLAALLCSLLAGVTAGTFNCVGGSVYIVAHPDDDLLFQSPDLAKDIASRNCVTAVFLTSGDGDNGLEFAECRELGNEKAYALMANVSSSSGLPTIQKICGPTNEMITITPDATEPASSPTGFQSLRQLYFGKIPTIGSIDGINTWTNTTLKQALAEILIARKPERVRVQDFFSDYDAGDHSDHLTTARFAAEAARRFALPSATLTGYMDYPVKNFDPTLDTSSSDFRIKSDAFFAYTPFDRYICQNQNDCQGQDYSAYLLRQYQATADRKQSSSSGSPQYPPLLKGLNVAPAATAFASSASSATGQVPSKAIDRIIKGYPENSTNEWASDGGKAGTTFTLQWAAPQNLSSLSFGELANDGSATVVALTAPVVANALTVTVTGCSGSTGTVGLAELQAFSETAAKAVDGVVAGFPANYQAEWASKDEAVGAWLMLSWADRVVIDSLVLSDRPNLNDWVKGATVQFDDGTTVSVSSLDNAGAPTVVNLTRPVTASSLKFTVTSVSDRTGSVGLAEIEVFNSNASVRTQQSPATNIAPKAATSASSAATNQQQGASRAVDGVVDGYRKDGSGTFTKEWASNGEGAGATLTLTWPSAVQITRVTLFDRPNEDDQILAGILTFTDGSKVSSVNFGELNNDGTATPISLPRTFTASTLQLKVTSVSPSTLNVGLAEIVVMGA
ncbi:hypothetical protein DFJ73DRAFT_792472 [Zopfochytrium polystomum]|nr:hypothetical protein DFJ73DRAFT_792472 [Zopfochytrium polystomum]